MIAWDQGSGKKRLALRYPEPYNRKAKSYIERNRTEERGLMNVELRESAGRTEKPG